MSNRTPKGNVTTSARKQYGMHHASSKGNKRSGVKSKGGKFPVMDHRSGMSALKLRHNGKGVSSASVIAKVRRWANAHGDKALLAACDRAAQTDRS